LEIIRNDPSSGDLSSDTFLEEIEMIKKLALIAAAVVVMGAAPALAQGVELRVGGDGHRDGYRDGDRGDRGYRDVRRSRAEVVVVRRDRHRDWERRRPHNRTVIIER
jgi:hypothetical protein